MIWHYCLFTVTSSNPEGRIAILKLSERMVNNCFVGITGPKAGKWTELHGNFGANVKLMSRRVIDEVGLPHGTLLSGSSSFFLPIPPKMVFNFFSSSRQRWEVCIFVLRLFHSFLFVISRVSNLSVEDYLLNYKTFILNPYIWWSTVGHV